MSKRDPQKTVRKSEPAISIGAAGASAAAKPLRVLIIAPSPEFLGGQSLQAALLVRKFERESSLQVSFQSIGPHLPGPLNYLQRIKYLKTIVTTLLYCVMIFYRVRKYDVIHIFSASYWSFFLSPTPAILIAKLWGKKALLNYHSGEAEDHLQNWPTARAIIKLADKVVVPSHFLKEVFNRFNISAEVVTNAVDLSHFSFRERRNLRPVLISSRNFEPVYNVECVLRAFAVIQREIPEARLILLGDGTQQAKLRQLCAELELNQVEFVGQIAPPEMPAHYDRADIFVNGSNIDNLPISLLEAFACGLPVVTTNPGGIPYMLTHERTGLMASCGDYEALARAVVRLLNEPELAMRLSRSAREDCQKYVWPAVREGWFGIYRELSPENRSIRDGSGASAKTRSVIG